MNFSLSRRQLLKVLPAGLLLSNLPGREHRIIGGEGAQNIRWAQGWLLWRNFKKQNLTLRDALNDLHAHGADGIEFSPGKAELERQNLTAESLKELLGKLNLAVSGNYFSAPFHETARREEIYREAQNRFKLLQEFGARNMIIGPPGVPDSIAPAERVKMIKQASPVLNELGRRALNEGIQIGIHPHLNTLIETPAEIDVALETTDAGRVFFSPDTGHIYLAGGDVLGILRKYRSRLNYFHFKDAVRPFVRPHFESNLRELGQGEIDFKGIMLLLKQISYRGWINVEQDSTLLTPQQSSKISAAYVRQVLKPIYT